MINKTNFNFEKKVHENILNIRKKIKNKKLSLKIKTSLKRSLERAWVIGVLREGRAMGRKGNEAEEAKDRGEEGKKI